MLSMSKPRKADADAAKKRYPSREKLRYVAIPVELHEALQRFAASRSDADDEKSVSWAARVAIRRFAVAEGLIPPPK